MKTKLAFISILMVFGALMAGERFQYVAPMTLNTDTYVSGTQVNTPTTGFAFSDNDRQDYVGVYVNYRVATATSSASGTFLMKFSTSIDGTTYDNVGTTPYYLGANLTTTVSNSLNQVSTNFFIPWAKYIRVDQFTNNFLVNVTNVTLKLVPTGDRFAK